MAILFLGDSLVVKVEVGSWQFFVLDLLFEVLFLNEDAGKDDGLLEFWKSLFINKLLGELLVVLDEIDLSDKAVDSFFDLLLHLDLNYNSGSI